MGPKLNIVLFEHQFKHSVSVERRKLRQTYESLVMKFSSQLWQLTQAKQLTGKEHIVLQALSSFEGDKGLFPSHTTIAIKAGCSVSTVIRTLQKAYELGLVERTIRRAASRSGRIVRGTNFYTLRKIDLSQAIELAKERAQKLRECLERKKQQFLNGFSKWHSATEHNSKSLISPNRQHHLAVTDYLSMISEWDKAHKGAQKSLFVPPNCS
ncbi:helix-turn-helix domain-containing protein [Gluconobacter cerinus]|uniref:helix-turn-helix domain-containing protein n=1 Tax=Gluconobacter cerinus TaxID=38307 RepID=UPI001B8B08D6|nr:helix-turn-helix domain-containing protein [Gluconobacter cerinus]MBS0984338.1 helix-turn-helix domain-containing protein [Gluconobacter cerinus]